MPRIQQPPEISSMPPKSEIDLNIQRRCDRANLPEPNASELAGFDPPDNESRRA